MTVYEAKKIIKKELDKRSLIYTKLTARTIDFTDLLRSDCIFVEIHGWKSTQPPDHSWSDLKEIAKQNGFCIE